MLKRIIYISALCLSACVFLSACAGNNVQDVEESSSDDNIIYAPVDTTEDNVQSEVGGGEPEDTNDTDVTEPYDTTDATDSTEPADTAEPAPDSESAVTTDDTTQENDGDGDAEPLPTPSETGNVISLGEDFWLGEHAAGSIVSRQNEKIRLVLSYDCFMNPDGSVTVAFEVGLECYDINCGPRTDGGKVTVNGDAYTFSTDEIVHEEAGMIYVPFETYIKQVDAGQTSCSVDVSWFFNGVYAGTKIDTLTVAATFDWTANN